MQDLKEKKQNNFELQYLSPHPNLGIRIHQTGDYIKEIKQKLNDGLKSFQQKYTYNEMRFAIMLKT